MRKTLSRHHVGAERIRAIDPLRGFAMALVIAQHAYHFVDVDAATGPANAVVYTSTRMASVAFMTISGMMIGYFLYAGASPHAVVERFRHRAIFLFLFAHPAIQLARIFNLDEPALGPLQQLAHRMIYDFPITDTIALCLLVAPALLLRVRPAVVAVVAAGLLVGTLPLLNFWHPHTTFGRIAQEVLLGSTTSEPILAIGWPLLPWLGIFLVGSLAGRLLADVRLGRLALREMTERLIHISLWLLATGVTLLVTYKLLRITMPDRFDGLLAQVLYPDRTTGMLPIYLAALATLLATLLWYVDGRGGYNRVVWVLSVFGRTSLFTYVTQFVFVHSIPAYLGYRGQLSIAGTLALASFASVSTWMLAYAYGRARGWIGANDYRDLRALRGVSPLTPSSS